MFLKEPGFAETNWHSDLRMAPFDTVSSEQPPPRPWKQLTHLDACRYRLSCRVLV